MINNFQYLIKLQSLKSTKQINKLKNFFFSAIKNNQSNFKNLRLTTFKSDYTYYCDYIST